MFRGGPYAPIGELKTEAMMELLHIKKGERAVDIGAGDGRLVIALAKKGAVAHGYEINPILVGIARKKIKEAGLTGKAFMHLGDFWSLDLSKFDVITIYLSGHIMKQLEKKLTKEVKPGARVAVNYFKLPSWKPIKQKNTIYLYKK